MKLSSVADRLVGQPMFEMRKFIKQDTIRFEIGDSSDETDYRILEATKVSLLKGDTKYTNSSGIPQLRRTLCNIYGFYENNLTILPANSAIDIVIRCLCDKDDEVIIVSPHFPTYSSVLKYNGINYREILSFDLKAEEIKPSKKTKLLIINSPCNPTGKIISREELIKIYALAEKHNFYVLSDEAYIDMFYGKEQPYSISNIDKYTKRTIVIRSYSKAFSMAGFRVGYCVAPKKLSEKIGLLFQTIFSCLPEFTQIGALYAECSKKEILRDRMVKLLFKRDLICEALNCPIPDGAIYVFPDISSTKMTGQEFSDRLLAEKNVAVLAGSCFGEGLDNYIRICFDKDENILREGIKRIKEFYEQNKKV